MPRHDELTEVLQQVYADLGRSQQRVARFILDDATSVAFLSAGELAERAGVHAATVVRLSQRLGYDGYPALQKDLRTKLSQYPTFLQQMDRTGSTADASTLLAQSFARARRNLELAVRTVDVASLENMVEALGRCQRVVVLGMGVARPVVSYLASCLRITGLEVHEPVDSVGMAQQLALTDERDVVVVVDFHRYYREVTRLAGAAKDSGAIVVAITDSPVSDLATYADHLLAVPSEGAAPRTSLAPAMVLVEAVLALVTVHDRSRAQRAMRRIDEVYERTSVFTAS
jgi:DNA-binding MurR/RpiR family transcriptional regulator